ncbi:CO5 protein, partial [Amia calva]|nr:CO5 protein [Amia calva]
MIPKTVRHVLMEDGEVMVEFNSQQALKMQGEDLQTLEDMNGKFLYIAATVIESKGGISQEGELASVQYILSPFTLSLLATPLFVKPGLPYYSRVLVKDHLGQPVGRVPLLVKASILTKDGEERQLLSDGQDQGNGQTSQISGTALFIHNIPADTASVDFSFETADPKLPQESQARKSFTALAYQSNKQRYVYIDWASQHKPLVPGDHVNVNVYFSHLHIDNIRAFSYQIISKGKIITVSSEPRVGNANFQNINFRVTSDMVPSARLLVYYIVMGEGEAELVADSIWMDIRDKCINNLQVRLSAPVKKYKPKDKLDLRIEAEHASYVALSSIDTSIYSLRTRAKDPISRVMRHIEESDLGCGGGGGKNNKDVFRLAGLTFITNANAKAVDPQDETCSELVRPKRSLDLVEEINKKDETFSKLDRPKRSLDLVEEINKKVNTFKDPRIRQCCRDGASSYPIAETCESRTKRIEAHVLCKRAFRQCCELANKLRAEQTTIYILARMELTTLFGFENPQVRSYFPESWLWDVYQLSDMSGVKSLTVDLPDSLTTWEMKAVGVSSKGICVSDPLRVAVSKEMSIDVQVPYSMVRGEQIELRGSIYNRMYEDSRYCVTLTVNPGVCVFGSSKTKAGLMTTSCNPATLDSFSVKLFSFTLLPLEAGTHTLTFTLRSIKGSESLIKTLRVEPEGIKSEISSGGTLDPRGIYGPLNRRLEFRHKNPSNLVPRSKPVRSLSITGELMGNVLAYVLDPSGLRQLSTLPRGSAEVELMGIMPIYHIYHYLEKNDKWELLGPDTIDKRDELKRKMKDGMISILSFQKKDENSFSMWKDKEASTWLTALVVKSLGQVSKYLNVDNRRLCNTIFWLKEQRQNLDGSFRELSSYKPVKLMGAGADVTEGSIYLTAFTLIGIKNAMEACPLEEFKDTLAKAAEYLSAKSSRVRSVYVRAITAYALALHDKKSLAARNLYESLKSDAYVLGNPPISRFWKEKGQDGQDSQASSQPSKGTAQSVETTAYALLTTLLFGGLSYAKPVLHWLTHEQHFGGGFYSTQDTVVTLESLMEYSQLVQHAVLDMEIQASYRTLGDLNIVSLTQRQPVVKPINVTKEDDVIVLTGNSRGVSIVNMQTVYYSTVPLQSSCNFDLTIESLAANLQSSDFMEKTARIKACAKYKPRENEVYYESGHAVMEIYLPTGLVPIQEDLDTLANGVDYLISEYKILDDRVTIQVDSIPSEEPLCVGFRVRELFRTGMVSSSLFKVFEYHNPDSQCSSVYYPHGERQLLRLCDGEQCQCMEAECSQLKSDMNLEITVERRLEKACEADIAYAYKVEIVSSSEEGDFVLHTATIADIFKKGADRVSRDSEVTFIKKASCTGVSLQPGGHYLVMGREGMEIAERPNFRYRYPLDSLTWLELWPSSENSSCPRCSEFGAILEEFSEHFLFSGCS